MSTVKQLDNVREGYPELHDFDGSEYVRASDYDERLHASDVYFDSWKNKEAQFNQLELELDAACGEIALLQQRLTVAEQRHDALGSAAQRYLDFRHAGDCGQGYQFSGVHPQTELKNALKPAAELPPMTLVEGDKLPPIGGKVFIHLSSSDSWVEHKVVGYYVWSDLQGDTTLHRVFIRVRDSDGYLNARLLKDIRLNSEG